MRPSRKVWLLNVENLRTPDPGVLRKGEALSGIVSCSQAIGSNFQSILGSLKTQFISELRRAMWEEFQSLLGSLKTKFQIQLLPIHLKCFNPF